MNIPRMQSRRRFLSCVSGGFVALQLMGCRKAAYVLSEEPNVGVYEWSGIGFGIEMSMQIHGVDERHGVQFGIECERIIAELEQAFSLYQGSSELSRLNRDRVLEKPSDGFLDLLNRSIQLESRTLGYYQPAIHGAWQWLQAHAFKIDRQQRAEWQRHCAAADTRYIETSDDGAIRLTHPLTQLSMNAIGQGYLADRVAAVLRREGVSRALLQLGETYAIGDHPDGRLWKLAVKGTGKEAGLVGEVELADAGLAVSANEPGRLLIDPVSASLQEHDRVAAVVSTEGAAVADAFATAFAVAPEERWGDLAHAGIVSVRVWQANRLACDL